MRMHGLALLLVILAICFIILRLKWLFKRRKHSDYLLLYPVSILRTMIITSFNICTIAIIFGMFGDVCYSTHSWVVNEIMAKMIGVGMIFMLGGAVMPFFFLQQIEVTGKGVALNDEPVTWSLKRFSTQKECTCYIQIYKDKKEKLYLITNLKNLRRILKNTIASRTDKIAPSERRENQLIDILDALKKDTKFNFFTKKFYLPIIVTVLMAVLSIIIG